MSAEEPVDQFNEIFDFLDITTTKTKDTNLYRNDSPYPEISAPTLNKHRTHRNSQNTRLLAQRIAETDGLVKKIHKLETENTHLQQQLNDLKESAKEVHKLYEIEKSDHKQLKASTNILKQKCENFEADNYKLKHEYEQLEATLTQKVDVEKYDRLVVRYIKLTQKGDEYNVRSSSFGFLNDLHNYCIEKNLSGVPKRLSPKKRIKKSVNEKSIQCDLMQFKPYESKSVSTQIEHKNEETTLAKNTTRSQGTQVSNTEILSKKETRSQGTQHKYSTTTRGTTTASFIKKHDVGTMFPEKLPSVDNILEEFCNWQIPMPLSPITDYKVTTETIGTQTNELPIATTRTIGTCTYVCNVQRQVDYLPPAAMTIKTSLSRPPSRLDVDEIVKSEMSMPPNPTPISSRQNSESASLQFSALAQLENDAFAELWKIFGQILSTILHNRRASNVTVPHHTNTQQNFADTLNQQEFNNWLYSIYERRREENSHQQPTEPIVSNNDYNNCSSFYHRLEEQEPPLSPLALNAVVPEDSNLVYPKPNHSRRSYDENINRSSSLTSTELPTYLSKQLKSNQSGTNGSSTSDGPVLYHGMTDSLNSSNKLTDTSLQQVEHFEKTAEKLLQPASGSDDVLENNGQQLKNKSIRKKNNKKRKIEKWSSLDNSIEESSSFADRIVNRELSNCMFNSNPIQTSFTMTNNNASNNYVQNVEQVETNKQAINNLHRKEDCKITYKKLKLHKKNTVENSNPAKEVNAAVAKSQAGLINTKISSCPIAPMIHEPVLSKTQHNQDHEQLQNLKGTAMEHSHIHDSGTKLTKANCTLLRKAFSPTVAPKSNCKRRETCYNEVNMSFDSDGKSIYTEAESGIDDLVSDLRESPKSSSSEANSSASLHTKEQGLSCVFDDSNMSISSLSSMKSGKHKRKSFDMFELFGSDTDDEKSKEKENVACKLKSNEARRDYETFCTTNSSNNILNDDLNLSESDSEIEETEVPTKSAESRENIVKDFIEKVDSTNALATEPTTNALATEHETINETKDHMINANQKHFTPKSRTNNDAINLYPVISHNCSHVDDDINEEEEEPNLVVDDEVLSEEPIIKDTVANGFSLVHAETTTSGKSEASTLPTDSSIKVVAQNTITLTENILTTTAMAEKHGVKRKASEPSLTPPAHLTCKRSDFDMLPFVNATSDFVIAIELGKYTTPKAQPSQIVTRSRSKSLQTHMSMSPQQGKGEKLKVGFYNERQIEDEEEEIDKATNCDNVSDSNVKIETDFELLKQKHRKAVYEQILETNKTNNSAYHTEDLNYEKNIPPPSNLYVNIAYEATDSPLSPAANCTISSEVVDNDKAAELSTEPVIVREFTKISNCEPRKSSLLSRLLGSFDAKQCERVQASPKIIEQNEHTITRLKDSLHYYLNKPTDSNAPQTDLEKLHKSFINITTEWELIFSSVIQYIQNLTRTAQPKKPTFSAVETRLLAICQYLQLHHPTFILDVLSKLDSTLFHEFGGDKLSLENALNLTQLYLLLLRTQQPNMLVNPARLFIAKCIYYHASIAAPMIYEVLCVYPTVLPHREQRAYDNSDVLITVIKHHLMCTKYDMDNEELCSKKLLSKLRFEYHFEPFKPTREEVVQNLLDKLNSGKLLHLSYAFAILCKRMNSAKVLDEIVNLHLLPLANEYYAQALEGEAFDARIAALLEIISMVVKPMPVTTNVLSFINIFASFCNAIERPIVQEAAVQSILRLQRFGFANCFNALLNFKPTFELQAQTKAMLRRFVYRKPLYFWRTLQEHASITNN